MVPNLHPAGKGDKFTLNLDNGGRGGGSKNELAKSSGRENGDELVAHPLCRTVMAMNSYCAYNWAVLTLEEHRRGPAFPSPTDLSR